MNPAPEQNGKAAKNQQTVLLLIILLLLAIILVLLYRPVLPPHPAPHRRGAEEKLKVQKVKTARGMVVSYHYNAHEDINSIQIKSTAYGVISTDFSPHTASRIMQLAKPGSMVTVKYTLHPTDEIAGYHLREISNPATGERLVLAGLPPPRDIPQQALENFTLDNPQLITDSYGGIVALRKNSLFFHFKPGLVDDIMPLIKSTHHFVLIAVRRNDDLGFVNVRHNRVYIVLNLTIDNKTFLVR